MFRQYNLSLYNSYLFGLYGLFISVSVSISSFLAYLMLLLFIVQGNFKTHFLKIKNNFFVYAVLWFVFLHFLGLLWTEDFIWAQNVLKREWKLIFILLFMMIIKKEHFNYYLKCFILGMTFSEIVSYAIWFEIIPPFMYAAKNGMYTPFMWHLSYNIYLAVAISLVLHFLIHDKQLDKIKQIILSFFFLTMTINMFITGGRAGQIAFLTMLLVMSYTFLKTHFKIAISIMSVLVISFIFAYITSDLFSKRVNLAIYEVQTFQENHQTSVGYRIALALNMMEIIKENPLIGVGTGDMLQEYAKVNEKSLYKTDIMQPHNMYILVLVEFGLLGLMSLLALFYTKFRIAFFLKDELKNIRFAFIIMFLVIMLSNSYLYTHHTMVLYMFLSSLLFNTKITAKNE
jgi:O-antigen ligase